MRKNFMVSLLRMAARMPLGCLYVVSDMLYPIVYYGIGYRKKVVRRNLAEAFPRKSAGELRRIERQFYHFLCDVMVETVKLFHISPEEMSRRVEIRNPEVVDTAVGSGRCAALLLGHYGNWEWVQEITNKLSSESYRISIYHPLKNKLWDEVFQELRSRWHSHIVPQRSAVRSLLDAAHRPWICGFIADSRPDTFGEDSVIPFLNHYTSFIYGPEVIGTKVGADFFFLEMERVRRGRYTITFHKLETSSVADSDAPYPVMRKFWCEFEKVIQRNPAYWLWSHNRWKRDRVIRDS